MFGVLRNGEVVYMMGDELFIRWNNYYTRKKKMFKLPDKKMIKIVVIVDLLYLVCICRDGILNILEWIKGKIFYIIMHWKNCFVSWL